MVVENSAISIICFSSSFLFSFFFFSSFIFSSLDFLYSSPCPHASPTANIVGTVVVLGLFCPAPFHRCLAFVPPVPMSLRLTSGVGIAHVYASLGHIRPWLQVEPQKREGAERCSFFELLLPLRASLACSFDCSCGIQ